VLDLVGVERRSNLLEYRHRLVRSAQGGTHLAEAVAAAGGIDVVEAQLRLEDLESPLERAHRRLGISPDVLKDT
jgi:hypothetical protein